ncbi:MAG: ABC transporter substrate-binding protein [Desulfovibrio sp.]|jgi:phospholipid transport system substrate-binding protein|nr:ABC transporter substrate-binding protein [Desulfovibrio sp.]
MITSRAHGFLLSGILLAAIALCGATLAADAPSQARQELERTIHDILVELQKPELKNPATKKNVLSRVEGIIDRLFSFEELSSRTVGVKWDSFSPDQKKRFIAEFTTLLRESYLEKLDGYNGETVNYVGETRNTNGDKVEISTSVVVKGKKVSVAYRMLQKSRWIVYDVIIEGVSMVQNYRSQFQQALLAGDVEKFIEHVRGTAEKARAYNKK